MSERVSFAETTTELVSNFAMLPGPNCAQSSDYVEWEKTMIELVTMAGIEQELLCEPREIL